MYKPNKLLYKEEVLRHKVWVSFYEDNKLIEEVFDNGEEAKRFIEANNFEYCTARQLWTDNYRYHIYISKANA